MLVLNGNELKRLPANIGSLTSLTIMWVASNKLASLPSSIGSMKRLARLDVSDNRLRALPDQIGELGGNNGQYYMPGAAGGGCIGTVCKSVMRQGFHYFNVERNVLQDLPSAMEKLTKIKSFYAARNPLIRLTTKKFVAIMGTMGGDTREKLGDSMYDLSLSFSNKPAAPSFAVLNGRTYSNSVSCRIGEACKFRFVAFNTDEDEEEFGGMVLSCSLDGGYTVNATDLRDGKYTFDLPEKAWGKSTGKHKLTLLSHGVPVHFCGGQCVSPHINPFKLSVLPIVCPSESMSVPSVDGLRCVCKTGYARRGDKGPCMNPKDLCPADKWFNYATNPLTGRPKGCSLCYLALNEVVNANHTGCTCTPGSYNRAAGEVVCFEQGFDKRRHSKAANGSHCISCESLPCIQCLTKGGAPTIKAGYALASQSGVQRMDVPGYKALFSCKGGKTACIGGNTTSTCGANYKSALCSLCADDFFHKGEQCSSCENDSLIDTEDVLFLSLCLAVVAVAVLAPQQFAAVRSADIGFIRSGKIVISFFQVSSALELVLDVPLANLLPLFTQLNRFSKYISGNLSHIISRTRCLNYSFYTIWLGKTIFMPFGLVFGTWVVYRVSTFHQPDRQMCFYKLLKTRVSFIVCLLYPSVSHQIFSIFVCRKLSDDAYGEPENWLVADMSVPCSMPAEIKTHYENPTDLGKYTNAEKLKNANAEYLQVKAVAWVLMLVVPIGIPLAFAVFFAKQYRSNRETFDQSQRDSEETEDNISLEASSAVNYNYLQLSTSFIAIVRDYKPRYFYFEILDWLRKVCFTGLLLFVAEPGSTQQLMAGSVMAMLFLLLQAVVSPFERHSHNILKCFELFTLVLCFQTVMVIKLTSNDNPCSGLSSGATCLSQPGEQCIWLKDAKSCQWSRLRTYDAVLCFCLAGLFVLVAGFTASALHQATNISADLRIGNVGFDRRIGVETGVEMSTINDEERPRSNSQLESFKRMARRSPSHDSTGNKESAESAESSVFSAGSAAAAKTKESSDALRESTSSHGSSSNSSGTVSGGY